MTPDKFNDAIALRLADGRLNHVIDLLKAKCESEADRHPDLNRVIRALDLMKDTYAHLRHFLIEGNVDPDREAIYESLKQQIRDLGRQYLFIVNENRLDSFFAEYRIQKVRHTSVALLAEELSKVNFRIEMAGETEADPLPFVRKREEIVDTIFRKVWSLPPWEAEDHKALEALLTAEGEKDFDVKAQVISALMLGLLKFNDPAKFLLLLKAYEAASDERLAARALTAIVIVLGRWGDSALSSPAVSEAVMALEDSILTYSRMRNVVMTLIRTRDTDRVSREVRDAFDSTMKHISPEMLDKLRREGMSVDTGEMGMNPEWEKIMQNKELEEKMQAINDMQLEGMDVMMQTFARLKNFSFFRRVSNWLLPFSAGHSEAAQLFSEFNEEGFRIMADATEMCSGDRFSFIMGIMQMPKEKRDMLAANVNGALEMMKDQVKDRENVRRRSLFDAEVLSFARDLYRFVKLYPKKQDFFDPFEEPIDFLTLPLLRALLSDDEIILQAADFYFDHGYYPLALSLFETATATGEADRRIYEKIGFSYQMTSDYAKALENYEKADLFSSDTDRSSEWLLKKLAFINKALGNYERAAEYYRRLLERNPEDLNTEYHLGSVLLRAGEVEEGKKLIAKVRYLNPEHKACNRLYLRLKGHEAFIGGNYREALDLYEQARGDRSLADFRKDILAEIPLLYPSASLSTLRILLDS